ncbi:hypothetical protein EZMO1_3330 [Endozoicomonas montiporae CL-33]|uniref:Uncharacterized protein n=1 Tax=Endozoicomonas montiporae CL-33 TaxID=570277 RepID=A0A142BEZ9_9GAMM|nr:hypothetical protein EZMO1_3330 [Endozoicomonas montiporae CL-33]
MVVKQLNGFSDGDPSCASIKQLCCQPLLQSADLTTDLCNGNTKTSGGQCKRLGFCNGNKLFRLLSDSRLLRNQQAN